MEERIAELEATTARKGNRKVSLTISGWVGEQVMWWDDGVQSNVYVVGLGTTLASHFKMTGQAQIMPGYSAGYVIHVEVISSDALTVSQFAPIGPAATAGTSLPGYYVQLLQSYWFVKSDHLGKVGVGLQSQASDNTAILPDGSGSLVPANWVAFEYSSFFIRTNGTGIGSGAGTFGPTWGSTGGCVGGGAIGDCNGLTQHVIRYDSPTFGGFSVSASWGEDDMWDVAARYAGEHHGFKFSVAAAYNELQGPNLATAIAPANVEYFQIGAYAQHVHSGLWLYGAYGHNEYEGLTGDADVYYIKGGLRRRWHPLGHTVLYGEYEQADSSGALVSRTCAACTGGDNDATSSEFKMWGVGLVQEIDAAAMSMWLSYRHMEYSDNGCLDAFIGGVCRGKLPTGSPIPGRGTSYQDFQYVKFGALINF